MALLLIDTRDHGDDGRRSPRPDWGLAAWILVTLALAVAADLTRPPVAVGFAIAGVAASWRVLDYALRPTRP